jgi:ankyrin repeat protein
MTGHQLCEAALVGDAAKVGTLLSTQGAQSFINYQDAHGSTPILFAAQNGHSSVTEMLIQARCNMDLQREDGCTPLFIAAEKGALSDTLIDS